MQVTRSSDAEAHSFANHREGDIKFQRLLQGDADAPGNFEWSIIRFGEDYTTPRHHHNFSQIHYVLEGLHEWAPDHDMPQGSITYAPEGVFYGPQQGHGALVLGLQFGDASGSGFMSYDRLAEGNKRLNEDAAGEFSGGVWRYVDGDGTRRNKDGYEAIWEEMHGRPVAYPTPRYQTPVTMLADAFAWIPTDEAGIDERHLGTFTERRTTVGFLRYEGGSQHRVGRRPGSELHFVLDGTLRVGDGVYGSWTAFEFDPDDHAVLEAVEPTTTYVIGLPAF